jgi:ABC-type sugar transport system substrate-binding protein
MKQSRTIYSRYIMAFLMVAILAAFASSAYAQSDAAQGKHIAYITAGLDVPFWRYFAAGLKKVAAKHDSTVAVYDSHHSTGTQLKNAQDAVSDQVDGIVLSPMTSTSAPAVLKIAKKAGIPVVIGDVGTTAGTYVSFIVSDNRKGAYETGKVLAKKMKAKGWDNGKVGLVTISLARTNGQKRTSGFRQAMKEAGSKIVALNQMQAYTDGESYKFAQDMMTANPDLHGLFIETDNPTLGAARAIQASHRGDSVLLAGFDGVPKFVNLIKNGKLAVAGMQQPHLMGVRSGQALFQYYAGKTPDKKTVVPILIVTKKNIDKLLPKIKRTVFANQMK